MKKSNFEIFIALNSYVGNIFSLWNLILIIINTCNLSFGFINKFSILYNWMKIAKKTSLLYIIQDNFI